MGFEPIPCLSVIYYVINQTEDYISKLKFVTDFNNFLIIIAVCQHLAYLEYISLANLTIRYTTNREVSKNNFRITHNKYINLYTNTHYTSYIKDALYLCQSLFTFILSSF